MIAPALTVFPGGPASQGQRRRRTYTPARILTLLISTAAIALVAGCAAAHSSAAGAAGTTTAPPTTAGHQIQGHVGSLVLEDGYVPEPASPDVAAAYLTIVNNGDAPTRLTAVSSDSADSVMPMAEATSGGVGRMTPLKNVAIPAHGTFRFRPGAAHLMLQGPHPSPVAGDAISVSLSFSPSGAVTISLPVTHIGATP